MTEQQTMDVALTSTDIQRLANRQEVIRLFARLGYETDDATPVGHAALGLDAEQTKHEITGIYRVGQDPDLGEIVVYLFEVRSVTKALIDRIAASSRNRGEQRLLVVTKDYETLDFVLVVNRQVETPQGLKLFPQASTITVNRRNPERAHVRAIRRWTFTEGDTDRQWTKLRGAFGYVATADEHFNNRALFSDHYLKERLTDPQMTPAWREDVGLIGRELLRFMARAGERFGGLGQAAIWEGLYKPLFASLRLAPRAVRAGKAAGEPREADYLLCDAEDPTLVLAGALTYPWDRNLDDADPLRDPERGDDVPGARVVSVLAAGGAPWAVVTNGKMWRLYGAGTENRSTNYYEVDLEEALEAEALDQALRYWWLFFRREAFAGFLDELARNSAEYAKGLRERLKNRVFEEVFPHFATGFYAEARRCGETPATDEVFAATLTFLYRLMFVLYAESLDLLPARDERRYGERSLARLKRELAAAGGTIQDEAPAKLAAVYGEESTELYGRLQWLFGAIDKGNQDVNLPMYNGGLFSGNTAAGEFLATHAIPDRQLALGLDALSRDLDDRTRSLVMVDYKSLGVRHLGSIYEGLLEFKLKIADEPRVAVKQDRKEVYVRPAEAGGKKVLKTVAVGEAYITNDKAERKASGSYYTPDYIVKYTVEHTVGPVLARKFEELRPRLDKVQKQFRDWDRNRRASGNTQPPETFWRKAEPAALADACLDIKVLDPATGSGHFLVAAVDFISDRLIEFLNGWSENPVWALLERTQRDILEDMERQGVEIDRTKLTRVALLRRAVLKRCIYGVDLNAMAVELAKLSLWLDAFTLGAPLSFLDHHLRHGNSLIGVQKVEDHIVPGTARWGELLRALSNMVTIGKLLDATQAEVTTSQELYRQAEEGLRPFKERLNVQLATAFDTSLAPINHALQYAYLDAQGRAESSEETRRKFELAQRIAAQRTFFHWKIEFPEVFVDASGQDWKEDGGFDVVIGNPPWGAKENLLSREDYDFLRSLEVDNSNYYPYFIVVGLKHVTHGGKVGLSLPDSLLVKEYVLTRTFLLHKSIVAEVVHLSEAFEDVDHDSIILLTSRGTPGPEQTVITRVVPRGETDIQHTTATAIPVSLWQDERFDCRFNLLLTPPVVALSEKLFSSAVEFRSICETHEGIHTRHRRADIFPEQVEHLTPLHKRLLLGERSGDLIEPYHIVWNGRYVNYDKRLCTPNAKGMTPDLVNAEWFTQDKLVVVRTGEQFTTAIDRDAYYLSNNLFASFYRRDSSYRPSYDFLVALLNSRLLQRFLRLRIAPRFGGLYVETKAKHLDLLPIRAIQPLPVLADSPTVWNLESMDKSLWEKTNSDKTHSYYGALVILSRRMTVLKGQLRAEALRFLTYLVLQLPIQPDKNGAIGLDSLNGKSVLQNYPGDYQKNEPELPWDQFYDRLFQNRRRFGVKLADVKGEIEAEYEKSLAVLRPIKEQLAYTDNLIDKIVYRLYGLTEEEIEIIERPGLEQSLADAKAAVAGDKALAEDPERAAAAITDAMTAAGRRLRNQLELPEDRRRLDADLPGWHLFPEPLPDVLLTAEYLYRTTPEGLDMSGAALGYIKAVEGLLYERVFKPYRARAGGSASSNREMQRFLTEEKFPLTLGPIKDVLGMKSETGLRAFVQTLYPRAAEVFFGPGGVVELLRDERIIPIRNAGAHGAKVSEGDAKVARAWAVEVLGRL